MARIITVEHINETRFYQIPKAFFHNSLYKDMKNESKIAYSILRDLLDLSIQNNWINEKNEVYVKLSREKMMKYLNIKGTAKYADVMKELIAKELIVKKSIGLNRVDETYVCIPEELSIVYSDKELLEVEKNTKEELLKQDKLRELENQTSRSFKNKPHEVSKSNAQKFENQTHTDTNFTETKLSETNFKDSSKGIPLLLHLFNKSICELTKGTEKKFIDYVEDNNNELIESVISYCKENGARSFRYFDSIMKSLDKNSIRTKADFISSIDSFRDSKRKAKNRALKDKDIDGAFAGLEIDSIINDSDEGEKIVIPDDSQDLNYIKKYIKCQLSEIAYNAWIEGLEIRKVNDNVIIFCINSFTKDTIQKKYIDYIVVALKENEIFDNVIIKVLY